MENESADMKFVHTIVQGSVAFQSHSVHDCPMLYQENTRLKMTIGGRQMQRGAAAAVKCVDICSSIEEDLGEIHETSFGSNMERSASP